MGEVFNVGTGAQVSINEVAVLLKEQLSKTNLQDIHAPPRPPDVQHGYANLEKAKKLPGYNSSFSMKEGIKDLCKQYETRA